MKAMILAAGRGERMRPLTDKVPKPLLPVGGQPLITHLIKALARSGFADLVINYSYLGREIERELGDGAKLDVRIRYSAEPEDALETGGGIYRALPLLGEVFLVVNGDIWTDYRFDRLRQPPKGLAHLILVDNPAHHPYGDFALNEGAITDAAHDEPRLTFAGIGVYRAALFDGCTPGRFSLAPVLRRAIGNHQVSGEHYRGGWMDIGTPDRLRTLDTLLAR